MVTGTLGELPLAIGIFLFEVNEGTSNLEMVLIYKKSQTVK